MPKAVLELLVRAVRLRADALPNPKGRYLLSATLIWPRPLIAQRQALRELRLENGACDLSRLGWHARVLFKENVQGRFAVSLGLSEALTDAAFERLIRAVASQALRGQAAGLTQQAPESILAGLWAVPFAVLARDLTRTGEPVVMATGAIDADSATAQPPPGERPALWTVPLVAAHDLVRTTRRRRGDRMQSVRKLLLKAGETVGEVVLERLREGTLAPLDGA